MQPKIIFLGTAGESLVYGRQIRASGGIIVHADNLQFMIDPGPGAVTMAAQFGINLRDTDAVFVTHNHINHCNDVNAVISSMTYGGIDKRGVLVSNKTVYNGDGEIKPYITKFSKSLVEKSIILEKGQTVGIGDIEIAALQAKHGDSNNIGLRFFTSQFNLVYSSDTRYFKELEEEYKGCDILILNIVHPFNEKGKQLSSDDAVKIINKVKPKLAIITHFGIKMLKADPLYEARDIQKKTGIQVISAKDGMVINPISYSAGLRQKTLKMYK
jgi:ribonuclease BN (tRNA processing enzyme)